MKDKDWKRLIALLFGGWVVIWIYRSMLTPVYAEIQETIGMQSNAAMGMIASLYFLGYTLMQIPSGYLVRRWGQKQVILPGFLILAAGTVITTSVRSLEGMYAGSVAAGIGCGTFYGSAFSLTAEFVPSEKKGLSAAMVNSGCSVGLITGLLGSTLLVKRWGMPWQFMGAATAVLSMGMALLFLLFLHDDPKQEVQADGGRPCGTEKNNPVMWKPLLACSFLYFATCYVYYLIITWLPDYLESERGLSGGVLGIVSALICITAVPGGLYFAVLSDRWSGKKQKIVVFLEFISVMLVCASMLAPNMTVLAVMLLLYGFFGKISVDPVLISCITDFSDSKNLALTLSIFNCCGMSGSVIAPILTGRIKDISGSGSGGFFIGAGLLAVSTAGYMYMNRAVKNKFEEEK